MSTPDTLPGHDRPELDRAGNDHVQTGNRKMPLEPDKSEDSEGAHASQEDCATEQNQVKDNKDADSPSRVVKLEQMVSSLQAELKLVSNQLKDFRKQSAARSTYSGYPFNGLPSGVPGGLPVQVELRTTVRRLSADATDQGYYNRDGKSVKSVITAYYGNITGDFGSSDHTTQPNAVDAYETSGQFTDLKRVGVHSVRLQNILQSLMVKPVVPTSFYVYPPWKLFLGYEHQLREVLGRKEKEYRIKYDASTKGDAQGLKSETKAIEVVSIEEENHADKKPLDPYRIQLEEEISHLRCLLGFIETDLDHLRNLRAQARDGTLETIAFENVWHLFNFGDVVLTSSEMGMQAYRVEYIEGCQLAPHAKLESFSRLVLGCFHLHFDAPKIRAQRLDLEITPYHRDKRIAELDVYPARFHKNAQDHMAMLMHRGLRYRHICLRGVPGHKTYNGLTVEKDPEMVHGEVYVDFEAYPPHLARGRRSPKDNPFNFAPTSRMERRARSPTYMDPRSSKRDETFLDKWIDDELGKAFEWKNKDVSGEIDPQRLEMDEKRLKLLPRHVPAYVFRSRTWRKLDICVLQDIDYNEKVRDRGFEQLVIPESHRNLLLALVNNHPSGPRNDSEQSRPVQLEMDLVKGKGTGLILLLHGPPGVGKTSTAETIAVYTRRPLYPITCGDLGATPKEVEASLENHFTLAHRWGCVLLLDEADVFLAKRDRDDVVRNGLVSVFLRTLEYYSGILFLTTNRVGVMDEAFKSRIHVSLRYPSLNQTSTEKIWSLMLDRIEEDNKDSEVKIEFERDELLGWATKHYRKSNKKGTAWNGRQIRNAFQTSMALAQYDRAKLLKRKQMTHDDAVTKGKSKYLTVQLSKDHFGHVALTAKDFEKYMTVVRHADEEIAIQEQLRNDRYDASIRQPARKNYNVVKETPPATQSKMHGKGRKKNLVVEESGDSSSSDEGGLPGKSKQQEESDSSTDE